MSDCAWCEPDEDVCHVCAGWDGPPPPVSRAVGGYAYLMCEDAVPVDNDDA